MPYRVDKKTISDSIITEIVSSIANCRLFFADVSSFDKLNDRPIRNENVLYEVGIAHSSRLAEEVILFRSDNEYLMFDLSNIRVNRYDPDKDINTAKCLVMEALKSALEEVELQKHFYVQKAVDNITLGSLLRLFYMIFKGEKYKLVKQVLRRDLNSFGSFGSTDFLINSGILITEYPELENGMVKDINKPISLKLTPFGKAVAKVVASKYGLECDF
jgi:hypothetical protein